MAKRLSDDALSAWIGLIRAERSLLDEVERQLATADLPSLEWYDVLWELDRAEAGSLRHRDLYPKLLLAKHNLSRLLDRLEAADLIERRPCKNDARGADILITSRGRALRRRMWPVYEEAIARCFAAKLDPKEIAALNRAMLKLVERQHRSAAAPLE